MWLRAEEALARLGSKPQSLYANVSRGRIRARPDPSDSRRSLYSAEDVDRLARRKRGRRNAEAVATAALNWGDPVLPTAVSTVSRGRLFYRGVDAVALADSATLEDVASLLWAGDCQLPAITPRPVQPSYRAASIALASDEGDSLPSSGQGAVALTREASRVLAIVANALVGGEGPLHLRAAAHFGRPDASDVLRRALVLLADHELTASTFAARVTVSTGASLAAGAAAGLAALGGPRHGSAASSVMALGDDLAAGHDLRDWLGEGRSIPGFRHRLYPEGDVRASALLSSFDVPAAYLTFASSGESLLAEAPNVDFALAAMCAAYGFPSSAPMTTFALARIVGMLAHMLEQVASGVLIRPRARYMGPPCR